MRPRASIAELQSQLRYVKSTGEFWWKVSDSGRNLNRPAGTLDDRPSQGYVKINYKGKIYLAHHLAIAFVTGNWPIEVDHRDLNRSNNRWRNLRPATRSQNRANVRAYKNNKSGFKRVHWDKQRNKWRASLQQNGKQICVGHFETPELAHTAYCAAAKKLFKNFARFN